MPGRCASSTSGVEYGTESRERKYYHLLNRMNSGTLINISDASNTISQAGASAAPVFNTLLPIGLLIAGILIGGLLVAAVVFGITGAVGSIVDRFSKH